MKRFMVGFILLSFRAGRPTIATRVACILAAALLTCASSVNGQVIEEAGLPVKGNDVSRESFSLSCPSRLVVEAGESLLLSCSATGVSEEGVRYEWESVSDDGLRFLSDTASRSPFFTAPVPGAGAEYTYRLTATGPGVYRTATVTVSVQGVSGEPVREPGLQEDCDPLAIPEEPGQGCAEDRGPVPFGFGFEEEEDFLLPEAPGVPDRGGGTDLQAPPRLECPVAVFLEELETGAIECHAWDAAGEQYLEYSWEPTGNTTRAYLDNPRLIPEDSPTPSVVVPEMPSYETLESFRSGDRTFRYRYRLTATSRATGLSSHEEVEVYVSSSRPVVYCPLEVAVEEGETVTLDCEGADPLSFRMDYDEEEASVLWEWEGLWGTSLDPLAGAELSSPLFTAPVGSAGKEYHYIASMTSSASGAPRTARRRVTVRVVEGDAEAHNAKGTPLDDLEVTCSNSLWFSPPESSTSLGYYFYVVLEGTEPFTLNCNASGGPEGSTYEYEWTVRAATYITNTPTIDMLSATDIPDPEFDPPDDIFVLFQRQVQFSYYLDVTATATGETATERIAVYINVVDGPGHLVYSFLDRYNVTEGDPDFSFRAVWTSSDETLVDHSVYSWSGTDVANRLSATDTFLPMFHVPDNVDSDTDYEYTLRITNSLLTGVINNVFTVTVRNIPEMQVSCASPESIYEGDPDFSLTCAEQHAPDDVSYSWSGGTEALALLSATDVLSPTFDVPEDVSQDTTYTYTLTASADGQDDATDTVTVTVLNRVLSITCTDRFPRPYEGSGTITLSCSASGAAPGVAYAYSWSSPGVPANTSLLSATNVASPVFDVPDNVDSNTAYEYLLTATAAGATLATERVQLTVLNKEALRITCTNADKEVYEGAEAFALGCSASGAPSGSSYAYAWTGDAAAIALLSDRNIASPTFAAPPAVDEDKTYEYTLTVSAQNAEDTAAEIVVTVLNKKTLSVFCAVPVSVFEGSEDITFDCEASGAPGNNPVYAYAWTGDAEALALLDANDIASPTFAVPPAVDEDKTYEYTLMVSAEHADTRSLDVTLKVLDAGAIALACTIPLSVYEGSEDVLFDCVGSGAPGEAPVYAYAWTGDSAALALLDANDIASPTFAVPEDVSSDETYEYTLTVSSANAEETRLDVAITVLNKRALSVTCTNADTEVYEGAENFELGCSASGAPGDNPVYTYAWTGDAAALALLSARDIASPTFAVPEEVTSDETYEYTLTVSAENADTGSLDITLKVLKRGTLSIACSRPLSVFEGSGEVLFDCEASGAPGANPVYAYAWTGDAAALALLSARDIASPTFAVPEEVTSDERYAYRLTVSAENAEDATLDVAITVLKRGVLRVACTHADTQVYEGSEHFELGCSASGLSGEDPEYMYAWTADAAALALLSANDIASPTFVVPEDVSSDETYEYRLTVSAENVQATRLDVTITVLNKSVLALVCTNAFAEVYEGAEDFELDCEASGASEGSAYEYVWTAWGDTPDVSLLSAADVASPTFHVPDNVDEDKTYEYLLTISAENSDDATAEVTVTVLNKEELALACADTGSVYEGSGDVAFDCEASGAPGDDPRYAYIWTASGDTQDTALLSAADVASPTFHVPDNVDEDKTYEYLLTASAQNADDATAEVSVTVLNKAALALTCADPGPVYEGSEDVVFDCSASGAPGDSPQYAYVWTARGDTQDTSLLSATDIAAPAFYVPDAIDVTTTYEYLLTASAQNADDATAEVAVTVLDRGPLAFADDALAGRIFVFTVGELIEDILLPQATGGFPPYTYTLAPALPEGLALSDPARTISGTPLQVSPRTEYAWQAADANAGSVSLAFFVEVVPAAVPFPPVAEPLSPDPEALALSGITTSVSPLRFGVQSADTEVALDPVTDRITTHISGPYHAGRLTLAADADEGPFAGDADEGPLAADEEIALSVELVSPVLLRREGDEAEPVTLALSPSWSYTKSCEGTSSEALGGLYTELLLSEGDCLLLLFGGELDLAGALPGRYEGVMDVILRQGETEETRTLEVDVTVVSPRRTITIGPAGVRLDASREMPAGLTENQNLGIYPDIAFLNAGKPNEAFELSNPSLVPLEISVSARFGYTEAAENGSEIVVEDPADSDLGDLSSVVDIHPSVLVLMPGEKGLVRYGIREEVLASLTEKGYAAFFDIVSSPRRYADQDRMPEEVAGNRTARVTMRIPGVYVPGGGASRLQAELLSITEGIALSATFLVEALDGPFMGEVIAYDGEGRELGRREALVYTRSRVRVPLSQRPEEDAVFLRFVPRGAGRVPEPASIRWNAPPIDIGEARDKDGATTSQQALARKP